MPQYNSLRALLTATLTVNQWNELPHKLGFESNGATWLGRRLSRPETFKKSEAERLAALVNVPLADLMRDYGVAKETLTAAEAEEIMNATSAA